MGRLLSARARYALRLVQARTIECSRQANVLHWRKGAVAFRSPSGAEYEVAWDGREEDLERLALLLGGERRERRGRPMQPIGRGCGLLLPGSMRVPVYIDTVMDLTLPVEETYRTSAPKIRRIIRRHLGECRYEIVSSREQARVVSQTMLRPYAASRHGPSAAQLDDEEVVDFALGRGGGSLKILVQNGQEVGCQLGFANQPFGVKTWELSRFGCPPSVFDERDRLDEVNTLNAYMAAVDARARGFAQLNFGMSLARPDGGLLHWKCSRGCVPEPRTVTTSLALRVPRPQRATFFAARPLFFVERDTLNLAIGWPQGMATAEFKELLQANHVRGLRRVLVYRTGGGRDDTAVAEWLAARDANCRMEYQDTQSGGV